MTLLIESDQTETVGDLLHRLGDIPPGRIRLHPTPGTATVDDVVAIEAREGRLFELIDGVLVEKGMGYSESLLASAIITALESWVVPRNLGLVTGEAGMMRILITQVRMPGVAFISWNRLPDRRVPTKPVPSLSPDLVVEILSESNTRAEMTRKRKDYFAAGVALVWEVDPVARNVAVYTDSESVTLLGAEAVLDARQILPGFELSLQTLFARLDATGA